MKKFIILLFVSALSIAISTNAMTEKTKMPKKSKFEYTKQSKHAKKITRVSLKALNPKNESGQEVMGWLNPESCGATGAEKCAIIKDPQGTYFAKEVSTRGRKGFGFVGDAEGLKKYITGKVLRVYKKTGKEPFMAGEASAYKASETASKLAKSRKKSPKRMQKTEKYKKYTKSNGGRKY